MNVVSLFLLQVVCLEFLSDKYHPLHKTNVKQPPPPQISVTPCHYKSNEKILWILGPESKHTEFALYPGYPKAKIVLLISVEVT